MFSGHQLKKPKSAVVKRYTHAASFRTLPPGGQQSWNRKAELQAADLIDDRLIKATPIALMQLAEQNCFRQ